MLRVPYQRLVASGPTTPPVPEPTPRHSSWIAGGRRSVAAAVTALTAQRPPSLRPDLGAAAPDAPIARARGAARLRRAALAVLLPTVALFADPVDAPLQLPRFFVPGERVGGLTVVVPRGDLRPPEPNLGPDLLALPGIASQARAADAMEPAIRGLGFDRVATTLNGLPLVNGSPERTNSPVVILGPVAVTRITVAKALPSVTLGPVTTAGTISLTTDPAAVDGTDGAPRGATLTSTANANRDGLSFAGRVFARAETWDTEATVFRNHLGDYTAADGREVAARFDDAGGSAGLGWHRATQRIRLDVLHRRLRLQDTLSLPLDGKNTDSDVVTLTGESMPAGAGALRALAWRVGYSWTDPYITSEDRAVPTLTYAQATSRAGGAGITSTWAVGEAGTVSAGADYGWQDRRAVRTTAAGRDFIWPDAVYTDAGVFAEWKRPFRAGWRLRLGGRLDDVRSDARDAGEPALGLPLRDQFVRYNGPAAATITRHNTTGAANLLLEWKGDAGSSAFVGAGVSAQPPPVTERYRAFLNALGGDGHGGNAVELGNPALRPERKSALEAGVTSHGEHFDAEATAYAYRVDDFILRLPVGFTPPPLPRMVVFGYRNVDAVLYGAEVGTTAKTGGTWSFPLTFALADGRNEAAHHGLPDLPPWQATLAARWRSAGVAVEAGGRIVGAKSNPAPEENPLFGSTGGFSVWHVRAGVITGTHVRLEAGLENLLNRRYTEYLTPPVGPFRPARGDLLPGDRVPAPGRTLWASATLTW